MTWLPMDNPSTSPLPTGPGRTKRLGSVTLLEAN
jgi:hypothetical protein